MSGVPTLARGNGTHPQGGTHSEPCCALGAVPGRAPFATLAPVPRPAGVTLEDVREIATQLPRSYEVFVYGRVKFRVGQIVWLAFSRDETEMGFAFPKELRQALVDSDPDTYFLPGASDMRFHWVCARLAVLDRSELRELVEDAWSMAVPKFVASEYAAAQTRAAG